ncbi:MAG: SDR family oxidoreductase [Saprospiraceae bacterium]
MQTLIIGATGNIGSEIIKQLAVRGLYPRIATRDLAKAKAQFTGNADLVEFDFNRTETFAAALKDIQKVFFIAPQDNPADSVEQFLKTAQDSDIQHVVFSSGRTTATIKGKPLYQIEQLVKNSELPYTIIRPGWFMQNFTSWIGEESIKAAGKFYLPAGDSQTAFIDVRDIAAVVVRCLLEDKHAGKVYELTSDEALSHDEVAQKIALHLHQPVQYIPLSDEDYIDKKVSEGWSIAAAKHVVMLYRIVRETGKEAIVSRDVEKVLQRLPISFDEFVEAYW